MEQTKRQNRSSYVPGIYYEQMRLSNFNGAKKVGTPLELAEASDVQIVRRAPPTNAHKLTTYSNKSPAARVPIESYTIYILPAPGA